MILSGKKDSKKSKSLKSHPKNGTKNKAKSLPGTLKQEKSNGEKNLYGTNTSHYSSTSSLSSGQVWQRHYKSKPQSPGLLTMIPPNNKENLKLKTPDIPKSTLKPAESDVRKANASIKRIQQLIQNGIKVMIIMRGMPGSGKSHLAQMVVSLMTENDLSQHILSTDDYFIMLGRGIYAYDYNLLPQAHNWNQKRTSESLKRGINPIVIDNTNTQSWEMQPYVMMAVDHDYVVEVLEPVTEWRNKEAELAKRNIHSVPREKIRQMLDRYEPGWTGEKLIKSFGLKYKTSSLTPAHQEIKRPTNSLLDQHRQHAVINAPEKPKRKKNTPKKKESAYSNGEETTEDKEKQLEELNKLFAEYGKTMDPVSKQKVIESGLPINLVVSRMRKLQGNILPLPKANVSTSLPKTKSDSTSENTMSPMHAYHVHRRESVSESVEPDTISSSNASETSEYETDNDGDLSKSIEMQKYLEYSDTGRFVIGEDPSEDYDFIRGMERKGNQNENNKSNEISSAMPLGACVMQNYPSQEDLSLLNYDGTENQSSGEESPSSEEEESQMLSLQMSLRNVLLDDGKKSHGSSVDALDTASGICPKACPQTTVDSSVYNASLNSHCGPPQVELSDSLLDVFNKRFDNLAKNLESKAGDMTNVVPINKSLLQSLVKKYSADDIDKISAADSEESNSVKSTFELKQSPDLEEVPLPSVPVYNYTDTKLLADVKKTTRKENPSSEKSKSATDCSEWCSETLEEKFEAVVNSWNQPINKEQRKDDDSPKEARPRNDYLGAIKKTGANTRDKSPEELLRSVDLSWSSIPFTSSWEDVSKKPPELQIPTFPKPPRKSTLKSDSSTITLLGDFDLWRKDEKGIIKLNTCSRNINENYKTPDNPVNNVSTVLMLDKGSMTLDIEEMNNVERDNAIETLCGMFPDIPKEHLSYVFDKCKGNLIWTIEVLLETPQNLAENTEERSSIAQEENAITNHADYVSLQNVNISDGKKTIRRRKDKKSAVSESSLLLKKQIEESIQINEDVYQDKTLFLKKLRHGEIEFGDGPINPPSENPNENLDEVKDLEESDDDEEEETIPMKLDSEFFGILTQIFGSSEGNTCNAQSSEFLSSFTNLKISNYYQKKKKIKLNGFLFQVSIRQL